MHLPDSVSEVARNGKGGVETEVGTEDQLRITIPDSDDMVVESTVDGGAVEEACDSDAIVVYLARSQRNVTRGDKERE